MNKLPSHKQTHTINSKRLEDITRELASGFEMMSSLGPAVAIFGSARTDKSDPAYEKAQMLSEKVVQKGFSVVTGGGGGIMEAANLGAQKAKGQSCGLCVDLPFEKVCNAYIDPNYRLNFSYFFVRKVMLVRYAQAFVIFPGGFGSLDELFEALTLIQTQTIKEAPIYLVDTTYWKGLIEWLKASVATSGNIEEKDFDLIHLTDDLDFVAKDIEAKYKNRSSFENF